MTSWNTLWLKYLTTLRCTPWSCSGNVLRVLMGSISHRYVSAIYILNKSASVAGGQKKTFCRNHCTYFPLSSGTALFQISVFYTLVFRSQKALCFYEKHANEDGLLHELCEPRGSKRAKVWVCGCLGCVEDVFMEYTYGFKELSGKPCFAPSYLQYSHVSTDYAIRAPI